MSILDSISLLEQNITNIPFLKEYIGIPMFIHLSPPKLRETLEQIDRLRGSGSNTYKAWPKFAQKYQGTPKADTLFNIIEFGLQNVEHFSRVLELLINLISIPSIRLYLQPLVESMRFMARAPDHPRLSVLEYYFSFKCTIDKGVIPYEESIRRFNDFFTLFQAFIESIAPNHPFVYATISDISSFDYVSSVLIKTESEVLQKIKEEYGIMGDYGFDIDVQSIFEILQPPTNPENLFPRHLIPIKRPKEDIELPVFRGHALSIFDAAIQVFHQKWVQTSNNIIEFLEDICNKLNPNNDVRFSQFALPIVSHISEISRNRSSLSITASFTYDTMYLQYGFPAFKTGDIVYVVNIASHNWIGGAVIDTTKIGVLVVDFDVDSLTSNDFNVVVKPPSDILMNINRIRSLPQVLKAKSIPPIVANSFIGFANPSGSGITVVNCPLGSSSNFAAAKWMSHNYNESERTLVLGTSSKSIDSFLKGFINKVSQKIPSMNILRLDLPHSICYDVVIQSRNALLTIAKEIDPICGESCGVAINYLKLNHPHQSELIRQLELLRPLEYISDSDKIIDYLKTCQSRIVCHLIHDNPQITSLVFNNLIIIDTCVFEDTDMLKWIANSNPSKILLFSPLESYNNSSSIQRMWNQRDTIQKGEFLETDTKSKDIINVINSLSPHHILCSNTISPPIVEFACSFIPTSNDTVYEVTISSFIFFKLVGVNNIRIVVSSDKEKRRMDMVLRQRASWNAKILMKRRLIYEISDLISNGFESDITIFCNSGFENEEESKLASLYCMASTNLIYWEIGSNYSYTKSMNSMPIRVALGESTTTTLQGNREFFEIDDDMTLLQFVQSIEEDYYQEYCI